MYTSTVVDNEEHCLEIMRRMEEEYKRQNEDFFVRVLKEEPSLVLRVHAVTILAELGKEEGVEALSDVLSNDPDPLVRHEAAFSLGQIGSAQGNKALEKAVREDRDPIVRHESAAALGSVGSQSSKETLEYALNDSDDIVRNSAKASLFNLKFLEGYSSGATARERMPRP
jgi:deoxyhypusine monooxygenase